MQSDEKVEGEATGQTTRWPEDKQVNVLAHRHEEGEMGGTLRTRAHTGTVQVAWVPWDCVAPPTLPPSSGTPPCWVCGILSIFHRWDEQGPNFALRSFGTCAMREQSKIVNDNVVLSIDGTCEALR